MVENDLLGNNLYKVLYGPLDHVYFISLQSKPSKSLVLYDDNYHQIYKIDVSSVTGFQRRSIQKDSWTDAREGSEKSAFAKYIFEIFFGTNNPLTFTFLEYEYCDAFCKNIELTFGVQVYNYGSLNLVALKERREDVKRESLQNEDDRLFVARRNTPHDFFKVAGIDSEGHSEPPATFSSKYPVIIEGTMEEGTFLSYRNIKTATLSPFTVYKVEWYLSKSKGSDEEFIEELFSTDDTFYLKEFMIGHYVMVKVYKAIKTYNTRNFVFSTSIKGPVVLSNYLAHNVLVNSVKDTVTHNVLMTVLHLRRLCKLNPPADYSESTVSELIKKSIQTKRSGSVQKQTDAPKHIERNPESVPSSETKGTTSAHSTSTIQSSESNNCNVRFTSSRGRLTHVKIENVTFDDSSAIDTHEADGNTFTERDDSNVTEHSDNNENPENEKHTDEKKPVTVRLNRDHSKQLDVPVAEPINEGKNKHIYDPMNAECNDTEIGDEDVENDSKPIVDPEPVPEVIQETPKASGMNKNTDEPPKGKLLGFLRSGKEKIRQMAQRNVNSKEQENRDKIPTAGNESQKTAEAPGLFSKIKEKIKSKGDLKEKLKEKVDKCVTKVTEVGKRVKERKARTGKNTKYDQPKDDALNVTRQREQTLAKNDLKKADDIPGENDEKKSTSTPESYDKELLSIELQICFKELILTFEEVKFTIPWNNLNVDKSDNLSTNPDPTMQQQLDTALFVIVKTREPGDAITQESKIELFSQSTFQRNVLYHSMLFNKHRGSHYSMDKCERELQQGFYAGIKKAYIKACKSTHEL
ncbi:hypothetical protein BEWA_008380 [Theileria equi strain WA]|uniref:Uncharacterized protein n=1 Tax=Theileria equi strain WA TaxID=1537102 RepID=L0B1T0_THEEQ|nr:hypothetical protein BEWA_008380 [Theileria equi strain WA]AFZ81428.1 hypothetical protein BEWA_008380 [Theileria equi strain WA]|eukprot:XP_004831094.1 hypothetical protein BEWA_008380 [Theileria equi strain WA]